jgi:hypothetical protein
MQCLPAPDVLQVDHKPSARYDVGMLQRYCYRILASLRADRYGPGLPVREAQAGVLAVEVSPTVEQRPAMGRRSGMSRLVEILTSLCARLYGWVATSRAGRGVAPAAAGDGS